MITKGCKYLGKADPLLWYMEWLDHVTHREGGWKTIGTDNLTPMKVICTGWVVAESDSSIYMVNHLDTNDGDHLAGQSIVKSCIVKAVQLHDHCDWRKEEEDAVH